jgi:hypothetical protein
VSHAATTSTKSPTNRMPHGAKARQQGVSTKTIDRWVEEGRLPPPDYINGRKFHSADAAPRLDEGKPSREVPSRKMPKRR